MVSAHAHKSLGCDLVMAATVCVNWLQVTRQWSGSDRGRWCVSSFTRHRQTSYSICATRLLSITEVMHDKYRVLLKLIFSYKTL